MIVWTRPKALLAVTALWAVLYLPGLGALELQGEEGRRILPAIDMLHGDSWIVPSVGGEDYYNKPPGINWLVAGAFQLTGAQNEWAARMVSAVFVLAFVLLLAGMDSPFLSVPARLAGAVVFLTAIIMLEKGRLIEIEAVYTCLTGLAVVWWLNAYARENQPWRQWIVPCLLLAFGALVKGPFLAAPFYAVAICVLAYGRKLRQLISFQHILGVALIVMIGGGWFYLAREQTNAAAMGAKMSGQLASRFQPASFHVGQWALAVLDSFPKLLPWVLMVPLLWIRPFTANIAPQHVRLFRGMRLGMVLGFAALCLMPGLESRYTIPAWPTAAVLVGWVLAEHRTPLPSDRIWRHAVLSLLAFFPLATAGEMVNLGVSVQAAVLLAASLAAALWTWRIREKIVGGLNLTLVTGLLIALCMLNYVVLIAPARMSTECRRPAAAAVNALVPPGETIYVYAPGYQSFLFYVRPPLKYLTEPDELTAQTHYLLMPVRHLRNPAVAKQLSTLRIETIQEKLQSILHAEARNREAREGEFQLLRVLGENRD